MAKKFDEKPLNNTVLLSFELAKRGISPADIAALSEQQIALIARQIASVKEENDWDIFNKRVSIVIKGKAYKIHEVFFLSPRCLFESGDGVYTILMRAGYRLGHLLAFGKNVGDIRGIGTSGVTYINSMFNSIGLSLGEVPYEASVECSVNSRDSIHAHANFAALMFPLKKLVITHHEYRLDCSRLGEIRTVEDLLDAPLDKLASQVMHQVRHKQEWRDLPPNFATPVEQNAVGRWFAKRLLEMAGFVDNFRAMR